MIILHYNPEGRYRIAYSSLPKARVFPHARAPNRRKKRRKAHCRRPWLLFSYSWLLVHLFSKSFPRSWILRNGPTDLWHWVFRVRVRVIKVQMLLCNYSWMETPSSAKAFPFWKWLIFFIRVSFQNPNNTEITHWLVTGLSQTNLGTSTTAGLVGCAWWQCIREYSNTVLLGPSIRIVLLSVTYLISTVHPNCTRMYSRIIPVISIL